MMMDYVMEYVQEADLASQSFKKPQILHFVVSFDQDKQLTIRKEDILKMQDQIKEVMSTQITYRKQEEEYMKQNPTGFFEQEAMKESDVPEADKINHKTLFIQYKADRQKDVELEQEIQLYLGHLGKYGSYQVVSSEKKFESYIINKIGAFLATDRFQSTVGSSTSSDLKSDLIMADQIDESL